MILTNYQQGVAWLREHGFPADVAGRWPGPLAPVTYTIPADSGVKTALARVLVNELFAGAHTVLIVDEYGIWPSAENRALFLTYRNAVAGPGEVYALPAQLSSPDETESLEGLLALTLYFIWGVLLASDTGLIVRTSHDEWMDIAALDPGRLDTAAATLDAFGLERATQTA